MTNTKRTNILVAGPFFIENKDSFIKAFIIYNDDNVQLNLDDNNVVIRSKEVKAIEGVEAFEPRVLKHTLVNPTERSVFQELTVLDEPIDLNNIDLIEGSKEPARRASVFSIEERHKIKFMGNFLYAVISTTASDQFTNEIANKYNITRFAKRLNKRPNLKPSGQCIIELCFIEKPRHYNWSTQVVSMVVNATKHRRTVTNVDISELITVNTATELMNYLNPSSNITQLHLCAFEPGVKDTLKVKDTNPRHPLVQLDSQWLTKPMEVQTTITHDSNTGLEGLRFEKVKSELANATFASSKLYQDDFLMFCSATGNMGMFNRRHILESVPRYHDTEIEPTLAGRLFSAKNPGIAHTSTRTQRIPKGLQLKVGTKGDHFDITFTNVATSSVEERLKDRERLLFILKALGESSIISWDKFLSIGLELEPTAVPSTKLVNFVSLIPHIYKFGSREMAYEEKYSSIGEPSFGVTIDLNKTISIATVEHKEVTVLNPSTGIASPRGIYGVGITTVEGFFIIEVDYDRSLPDPENYKKLIALIATIMDNTGVSCTNNPGILQLVYDVYASHWAVR